MGGNGHFTYVRAGKEVDQPAVVAGVQEFFRRGGAELQHSGVEVPPQLEGGGYAIAITPASRGWITVIDSLGGATPQLGLFLSRRLTTRVQVDENDGEETTTHGYGPGQKVPSNYPYRELPFARAVKGVAKNAHHFFAFSRSLADVSADLGLDARLLLLVTRILDGGNYELGQEGDRHVVRVTLAGGAKQISFISAEESRALARLLDPDAPAG